MRNQQNHYKYSHEIKHILYMPIHNGRLREKRDGSPFVLYYVRFLEYVVNKYTFSNSNILLEFEKYVIEFIY